MAGAYTKEQVAAYYGRIDLPKDAQKFDVASLDSKAALEHLKQLIKAHLLSVPFENLVSGNNMYMIIIRCLTGQAESPLLSSPQHRPAPRRVV